MKTILDRMASVEAALELIASELPERAANALMTLTDDLTQFREDLPYMIWEPLQYEGGEPCQGCPLCQRWDELYQIGDRTEYEPMSECQATTPHSCPHVQQILTGP